MYNADVSPALISKVTDAVIELVVEWQNRPQDTVYPIFYLDCIVLNVLELKYRGLNDIFIACVDGLRGSPDAINAAYPEAQLQLCIDHMACNSLRYVAWKDYKTVTCDLKSVYRALTEETALQALEMFSETREQRYLLSSSVTVLRVTSERYLHRMV